MKKIVSTLALVLLITLTVSAYAAEPTQPFADTVFQTISATLKSSGHVSFVFVTSSSQSEIYISSTYLYKQTNTGLWSYVCKLPTPTRIEYNTSSFGCDVDYSSYISSGTYRVQYTAVAGGHAITRNSTSKTFP